MRGPREWGQPENKEWRTQSPEIRRCSGAQAALWWRICWCKRPLEEGTAAHSRILAWRIPWAEEPGGLQSIGSQRVGYDWSDLACMWPFGTEKKCAWQCPHLLLGRMMKLLNQDLKDVGRFNMLLLHLTDRVTESWEFSILPEAACSWQIKNKDD